MLAVLNLLSSALPPTTMGQTEEASEVSHGSTGKGKPKSSSLPDPLVEILQNLTRGLRELKEEMASVRSDVVGFA